MLQMRKLTIVAFLLLLTFFHANAKTELTISDKAAKIKDSVENQPSKSSLSQSNGDEHSNFGYGITLGGTASTFDEYSSYRYGGTAGIYGTYVLFGGLNIRLEGLYFQNGGVKPDELRPYSIGLIDSVNVHNRSVLLQNIYVPLMLKYEFSIGNVSPFIGAGGSYLFNFSAYEKSNRTYYSGNQTETSSATWENVYDQYKRHTWGLDFSLGARFPQIINDYSIMIEARYHLAGENINASYINAEAVSGKELKSNSFMLTLSFGY